MLCLPIVATESATFYYTLPYGVHMGPVADELGKANGSPSSAQNVRGPAFVGYVVD